MEPKYDENGNEIMGEEVPMFHQFKRDDRQFLAIRTDNGIRVIDLNGNNYGGFLDLKSFDKFYKEGKVFAFEGHVILKVALY